MRRTHLPCLALLLLALVGCGYRELTAPCGPLAFAPEPAPPAPFASFKVDDCGEPRPVNAAPLDGSRRSPAP